MNDLTLSIVLMGIATIVGLQVYWNILQQRINRYQDKLNKTIIGQLLLKKKGRRQK